MTFNSLHFLESLSFAFRSASKLSTCSAPSFIPVLLSCESIKTRLGMIGSKVFKTGKCVILSDAVSLWAAKPECSRTAGLQRCLRLILPKFNI